MDEMLHVTDDKFYLKAQAYVVEQPSDLPREFASEFSKVDMNPSFLWIAGRYVQANNVNKKGHFWTAEDLESGEHTIKYVPLNVEHDVEKAVGTFVETKLIQRQVADDETVPEIQALALMWAANFPTLAEKVKAAHASKKLFFSMECVSERLQCLTCNHETPYRAAAHEKCEHLMSDPRAPRRFVNPVFLGGALTGSPAWGDANVTDVASYLTDEPDIVPSEWERMMEAVLTEA